MSRSTQLKTVRWWRYCRACNHPGGLHVIEQWEPRVTSCRCCTDCPGYDDGEFIRWSHEQTKGARTPQLNKPIVDSE
jgi:hypothetical protein